MSELLGYIAAAGPGNLPDYQRPVWSCGHEHATRGEAIECLRRQRDPQPEASSDLIADPATDQYTVTVSVGQSEFHPPQRKVRLCVTRRQWNDASVLSEMIMCGVQQLRNGADQPGELQPVAQDDPGDSDAA